MHTTTVRATSRALTLAFALSTLLFAWDVRATGDSGAPPVTGAEAFERSCARCHAADELGQPLRGPDGARTTLEMLRFLDDHGSESAREDRAIVEYLLERRAEGAR